MTSRQILALAATILAAVLAAPGLGRDTPSTRRGDETATQPTSRPAKHRQPRIRGEHDRNRGGDMGRPRILDDEPFTSEKTREVMEFV